MIDINSPLRWQDIAAGEPLLLSGETRAKLRQAHAIVQSIVARGLRAYGVNTGVGALSDHIIGRADQAALSRNIIMSHAVGVGAPLPPTQVRAIMAAAINNYAHGHSGLRLEIVEMLVALVNAGCTPVVPRQGSLGYLSHMAHIALVLVGQGHAAIAGDIMPGAAALRSLGLEPAVLQAKEGLSLVNGTPCVTGLACVALAGALRLLAWADVTAAMTVETQRCQTAAFDADAMAYRVSPGLRDVAARLRDVLAGSALLAAARGARTQDALSLRSIPHVHGAARDVLHTVETVVNQELASVTDNPIIAGTPEAPVVQSQAHAVGAAMGLAMDQLGVAMAQLASMSERRIDRMMTPARSGLPAFLARREGVASGFMIAQYTALCLVSENRRLAAPASLDAGTSSGGQEDMLCHATPAALKLLDIISNAQRILAIELLCACQSYDLLGASPAPRLYPIFAALRALIPPYEDDRPLGADIERATSLITQTDPN